MNLHADVSIRSGKKLLCGASLSALALVIGQQAQAQEATPPAETVTVTGTIIKGINPVGSNLLTVDTTEIKAMGAMTTDDVLGQIPQLANTFNSVPVEPTQINIGAVRPVIRYIPSQAIVGGSETLVLMNGQNMVGISGLATAPDPGMIPTVVLGRVDVLPDGASSIYGANAITGVINFVTRPSYEGFDARASLGMADGYTSFDASAIGGTSWGSGNAYLAYEHKSNSFLLASDRSYTNMDLLSVGGRDSRSTTCALPNLKVGNTWYAQTGYPNGSPGSLAANVSGPLAAPDPVTNAGAMNRCDTNSYQALYPKQEQNSVFGSFHQRIWDGIDFDTTVLWSNRLDEQREPVTSITSTINNTNPYFQSIAGETSQTVMLNFAPFLGHPYRVNWNDSEVFQFTPKLSIQLPFRDWELDLQGNYGRSFSSGVVYDYNSSAVSTSLSQQTIGGVLSPNLVASSGPVGNALDPYNINLTNPTLLNEILDVGDVGKAVQHVIQYGASVSGTLFTLPGGDVKAALGTRYSWDDYIAQWFIATPLGQLPGTAAPVPGTQDAVAKTHRTTSSGFGEIVVPLVSANNRLPLVNDFSLDVSGRIDQYSDFGGTNNYKLGFTWDPFEALTISGTKGTSYDAPSLADTLAPDGRYIYQIHATPNTTVPPGTSAADTLRPSIFIPGGNPNLGPELGSTWSLTADFHPSTELGMDLTGLDVKVTRYHIFIEDQIGLTPFNSPLLFQIPQYAQYYIINPTPAQVASYGYNTFISFPAPSIASVYPPNVPAGQSPYILVSAERNNIGNALLEGFDFSAKYSVDVNDFGNVTVGTSGTVSTKDATNAVQGSPWNSIQTYGAPLYAMTMFGQVSTGPFSGRLWMNYSPGFRVNPGTLSYSLYHQTRMGSFDPVNIYVGYDLDSFASWGSGARIGLTVNNIGDEDPPVYLEGGNATTTNGGQRITGNGSTYGRYFVLSVEKSF